MPQASKQKIGSQPSDALRAFGHQYNTHSSYQITNKTKQNPPKKGLSVIMKSECAGVDGAGVCDKVMEQMKLSWLQIRRDSF